jgi:thiamine-phosphate pyrophosphorylase
MDKEASRLCLATPPLAGAERFTSLLTEALSAGDVASLLIRFAVEPPREREAILRTLAPIAQAKGVAVLAEDDLTAALRAGVDGVQIDTDDAALAEAVRKLSPRYIVGAGRLETRDDAMRAGETGADYVLLEPERPADLIARVEWWAALFNTPCVARAESPEMVGALARAGADFILLDSAVWDDPRGPAAAVTEALAALKGAQT